MPHDPTAEPRAHPTIDAVADARAANGGEEEQVAPVQPSADEMPRAGYDIPRPMGPDLPPVAYSSMRVQPVPAARQAEPKLPATQPAADGKTSSPSTSTAGQNGNSSAPSDHQKGMGAVAAVGHAGDDNTDDDGGHGDTAEPHPDQADSQVVRQEMQRQIHSDISLILRSSRLAIAVQSASVQPGGTDDDVPSDDDGNDADEPGDGPDRVCDHVKDPDTIYQELLFEKLVSDMRRKGNASETVSEVGSETAKLSSRQLLEQCDSGKIISHYREYQLELFQRAKEKNSIVVLDTGSGKTMIAMLLLRHLIEQNMEARLEGQRRKICFFLVPSTPLVFQQAKTIQSNLPYPVESLCGALNTDAWDREKWNKVFSSFEIVVCTGEILNQCLRHGFILMKNINLIVFDETHHARKNHVYAEIAKSHYHATPARDRPRLFGMTASPVNGSSDDMEGDIAELERLVDGHIITTTDPALSTHSFARPKEIDIHFESTLESECSFTSPLGELIGERLKGIPEYSRLASQVSAVARHLGWWAGDVFWKFAFNQEFRYRIERRLNRDDPSNIDALDEIRRKLDDAYRIVKMHIFPRPELKVPIVSRKLVTLVDVMTSFAYTPQTRCLVFVQQKITAQILSTIFSHPNFGPLWVRPGLIIGGGSPDASLGEIRQSVNEQLRSMLNFRKGTLNCLFATSVAEEGLDIPDCNLVVRFDLYTSMIQYVQSRGRARHPNSKYYHFLEQGNFGHQSVRDQVKHQEESMRWYCRSLPADRRVNSADDGPVPKDQFVWENPVTGARLTQQSAVSLVYHLASNFPSSDPEGARATFVIHRVKGQFRCEIVMPQGPPIFGALAAQKTLAKRLAACKACQLFVRNGLLDGHLVPTISAASGFQQHDHDRLALDANKKAQYVWRLKPAQWKGSSDGGLPIRLYMTSLNVQGRMYRPHKPLCLLTRTPIPANLPIFHLFLDHGGEVETDIRPHSEPISVDSQTLEVFTSYTLRIFRDVFSKTYKHETDKMTYWVVPLNASVPSGASPSDFIDFANLADVHERDPEVYWTSGMDESEFVGKYIIDRWDKRRRGFSVKTEPAMKPDDPYPAKPGQAKSKEPDPDKNKEPYTILRHSVSLWKASQKSHSHLWDHDQPVVQLEMMFHRIQTFIPPKKRDLKANRTAYICPQLFRISALRFEHVLFSMMFPAMIHRIEQYLVAMEGVGQLGLTLTDISIALEMFTVDLAGDDEYENMTSAESMVNRQNVFLTMGPSYERLEFLGDSFLKMAVSIELFCTANSKRENEFKLHENRKLLVCNSNLFKTAREHDLPQFGRAKMFSRRAWYPQGLELIEGKKTDSEDQTFRLSDKGVADICEAAIGACFVETFKMDSWSDTDWDAAIDAVTTVTDNSVSRQIHTMSIDGMRSHKSRSMADYKALYKEPDWACRPPTEYMKLLVDKIAAADDGYRFENARLLQSAFTHQTSVLSGGHSVPSYQLLEFLGDSLLDIACVEWLYFCFPGHGPEWMTKHKMAIVSNQFFAVLAVKLGFSSAINHCSTAMGYTIQQFDQLVGTIESSDKDKDDDENTDEMAYFWTKVPEAPKFLSDVIESYVGALFIDSGFDFNQVRRFFNSHIKPYFASISMYDSYASKHPINALQDSLDNRLFCQKVILRSDSVPGPPIPNLIDERTGKPQRKQLSVAVVIVHDKILSRFVAVSSRLSKTGAARQAVSETEKMTADEFREAYGCTCNKMGRRDINT